jgi:hypothetical protein
MMPDYVAANGVPAESDEIEALRGPLETYTWAAMRQFEMLGRPPQVSSWYSPGDSDLHYRVSTKVEPDVARVSIDLDPLATGIDGYDLIRNAVSAAPGLADYFFRDGAAGNRQVPENEYWLKHRLLKFVTAVGFNSIRLTGGIAESEIPFNYTFGDLAVELSSAHTRRRIITVLHKLRVDELFTLGPGIMLRPSDTDEKNSFIARMGRIGLFGVPGPLDPTLVQLIHSASVIDITLDGPRSPEWPPPSAMELVENVHTAIRVSTGARATRLVSFIFIDSIGFGYGTGVAKNAEPPPPGEWERIGKSMAEEIRSSLPLLLTSDNKSVVETASRRLNYGSSRLRDEDALVDYMVGIESILTDESGSELTYKVSMRLAGVIGESPDERVQLRKDTTKLYDSRSKVLHGKKVSGNLVEQTAQARDCLRRLILAVVACPEPFTISRVDALIARGLM